MGQTGPTGAVGQGAVGPQGAIGPVGPQGAPGATGVTGPPGSVGLQGPPGIAGNQGPEGPAGNQGVPGNSIQGVPGAVGPQGPQGLQGIIGPVGLQGSQGEIGQSGGAGAAGPMGPIGLTGPAGPAGPAGQGVDASGNLTVNNITISGSLSITGPNPTGIHLSDGQGGDTTLSSTIPASGTLQINGVSIPMGASPATSPTASGSFTVSPDGTAVSFWCSPSLQSIPNWGNATCLGPQALSVPTGAGHAGVGGVWFGVSVPGLTQ